jgi:hypothetical protein
VRPLELKRLKNYPTRSSSIPCWSIQLNFDKEEGRSEDGLWGAKEEFREKRVRVGLKR